MVGLGVAAPLSTYDSATAELVRRELASVLESADFIVPERARRFLSYIVEESLPAGQTASRLSPSQPMCWGGVRPSTVQSILW